MRRTRPLTSDVVFGCAPGVPLSVPDPAAIVAVLCGGQALRHHEERGVGRVFDQDLDLFALTGGEGGQDEADGILAPRRPAQADADAIEVGRPKRRDQESRPW